MTFQALDLKEHQFLELCDEDKNPLEPSYSKGSTWLKYFGHLNSLVQEQQEQLSIMLQLVNTG